MSHTVSGLTFPLKYAKINQHEISEVKGLFDAPSAILKIQRLSTPDLLTEKNAAEENVPAAEKDLLPMNP